MIRVTFFRKRQKRTQLPDSIIIIFKITRNEFHDQDSRADPMVGKSLCQTFIKNVNNPPDSAFQSLKFSRVGNLSVKPEPPNFSSMSFSTRSTTVALR
jgi:hypothetical protein